MNDYTLCGHIFEQFQDNLPIYYQGRSVSVSDVIEIDHDKEKNFYYCDVDGFCPVEFSPELMKNKE